MTFVGLLGSFLVCLGYFLLVNGKVSALSYSYLGINFVGGVCLLAAILHDFKESSLGPAMLQAIMIGISLYGFYKARRSS